MDHHKVSILVLFLLLLSFSSHTPHVESTGFIAMEVFEKGIDFAKDLLINTAISELIPFELPKIEQSVKIPLIGTVHISLSNMVLNQVNVSSSTLQPGGDGGGLVFVVSGAKAYLTMDWSYHYGKFIVISDKGTASVEVKSMEIGLTVGLKNQQGTLQLSLLDSGCYVKDISIKMNGGASWLYQGLVDAFDKKIRSSVEDAISQKIKDAVPKLDSLLESLPKEVEVDKIASLNVTVVNDLVFSNSSISLEIEGLFTGHDDDVLAGPHNARHPSTSVVPCEGLSKMVGFSIHEDVLNSASLVFFNADTMHWIVDKVPNLSLFNTGEWKYVIPQLFKKYPNDDMNLNLTVTSAPVVKVAENNIDATVHLDVTLDVLDAAQVIPVACISSVLTLSGLPEITGSKLAGSIKLEDFSLSLKWSTIGKFHMALLKTVVRVSLETVVVPYVNLLLWEGLPLTEIKGYTLQNARIGYDAPRIDVCSDIASVQQRKHLDRLVMVS